MQILSLYWSCNWPKYSRIYPHMFICHHIKSEIQSIFFSIKKSLLEVIYQEITRWREIFRWISYFLVPFRIKRQFLKKKYSKKSLFSLDIHSSCFNNFNSFPSFFDCHCYAFYGIFSASSMYFATIHRLLIDGFLRKWGYS